MSVEAVVVDDDKAYRDLIEEALSTIDWKCRTAATVEEGFRLASELRPGLVITDIHLPDATGFDLCARIKASPELKDTRVLMVTGTFKRDEDRLRAESLGADAYLLKPFHLAELLRTVKRLLENRA